MTQETGSLHEDFLRTFYKLVYMAKIHQDNNQLLMECLDDFMQVIIDAYRMSSPPKTSELEES